MSMYELVKAGKKTYYMNGPYNIGIYKLSETEVCLIDSAVNDHTVQKLDAILTATGWIPKIIINTHYHADHIGGNRFFQEKYGTRILADKLTSVLMNNNSIGPSLVYGSFVPDELYNKYTYAPDSIAARINAANLPAGLKVFKLDGHAPEMIGVKTDDDVYFIADSIVGREIIDVHHIAFLYDLKKYIDTLDYLKTLKGKLFIPSHAKPLKTPEELSELVEYNKASVLKNIDVILKICEEPKGFDDVIAEFSEHYDLKNGYYQYMVNGSIIKSYISGLINDGRLEVIEDGKRIKLRRVLFD